MRIEQSNHQTTEWGWRREELSGGVLPEQSQSQPRSETPAREVRLLILFFSGTGNTQFVAEYVRDRVLTASTRMNLSVTLAALEWSPPDIVARYDLVCIGFPVYEGRAPRVVREHIDRFPEVSNIGCFVFNTKGLAQGRANRSIVRTLEKKGFRPLANASLVMPASDGISIFMKKEAKKFQEYLRRDFSSLPRADRLADSIHAAAVHLNSGGELALLPRDSAWTPIGWLLTGFFRLLYAAFGESAANRLRVTETCTLCGRCERVCPMGNITLEDERIRFGDTCVFCLRCVNNCPEEAVQVGRLSVNKARWHGPGGGYRPLRYKTPKVFRPSGR